MTVVPLRPDLRREEAARRIYELLGAARRFATPDAIDALTEGCLDRHRERPGRSLPDAALDVATCWLLGRADPECRRQVMRAWGDKVGRWARAGAGRGVDADDVAQEVLCRLAAHIERHRDGLALGGWLWRTTYLVLRESERRSWWSRWVSGPGDPEAECALPADPLPSAPEALAQAERLAAVRAVLGDLALEDRLLLWGAYVEDQDRAALADRFGWPAGTLNRRLTRAREAFRRAASARGIEGGLP